MLYNETLIRAHVKINPKASALIEYELLPCTDHKP